MSERLRRGQVVYALIMLGAGAIIFFPYILLLVGYFGPSQVALATALPVGMSALYSAAISAYILHGTRGAKELLINAILGFPFVLLFSEFAILVSFFRSFGHPSWQKVARERA